MENLKRYYKKPRKFLDSSCQNLKTLIITFDRCSMYLVPGKQNKKSLGTQYTSLNANRCQSHS